MFLIALDLIILARSEIAHLTFCEYTDSSCSIEDQCHDVCDSNDLCSTTSCDYWESTYTAGGMTEYGECYSNAGSYYIANCTDVEVEPATCSDFDICHVSCQSHNGGCGSGCTLAAGQNVLNSTDYNCDHMRGYYTMVYEEFEDFMRCFNNTADVASGEDFYLICNMDSPESPGSDSDTEWYSKALIPIVSITAVYCCIWIVWRQSKAAERKFREDEKKGTTNPI